MEGSALAGTRKPGQTVAPGHMLDTLARVNREIWYRQAQIAFSTASDIAIPVIEDPIRPPAGHYQVGDVNGDGDPFEAAQAADLCRAAWRFSGRPGIPVVNARQLADSAADGLAPPPDFGLWVDGPSPLTGKRGDDLCGFPTRVTRADTAGQFVVLRDHDRLDQPVSALAHELGHTLFLGHGNGLDDDRDGRGQGLPGPRRYDEYCDPDTDVAEDRATPFTTCEASHSLMHRMASCTNLRPLQIETARGVALVAPGAVDGTPRLVVAPPVRAPTPRTRTPTTRGAAPGGARATNPR